MDSILTRGFSSSIFTNENDLAAQVIDAVSGDSLISSAWLHQKKCSPSPSLSHYPFETLSMVMLILTLGGVWDADTDGGHLEQLAPIVASPMILHGICD